jgi:hypothetical protein
MSRPEFGRTTFAGISAAEGRVIKELPILGEGVAARLHKTKTKPATYRGQPIVVEYVFAFTFQLPSTSDDLRASARDAGTVR